MGVAAQLTSTLGTRILLAGGTPGIASEPWGLKTGPVGYHCLSPLDGFPILALSYLAIFLMTKDSMLKQLGEPELTESFVRGVECLLYSPLYLQDPVSCLAHGRGAQKLFVG